MDLLSDILSQLRLSGTLYFRTSFTSPWSVQVPPFENVSRFHFAHRGRCLVRVASMENTVLLEQGDLIIIMRGATHTLFCDPATEHPAQLLDKVVEESGFNGRGTLVYGEPGTHHETQLICGHFAFDKDAYHPVIDALPPYIHIENYGETAGNWMENTLKVIGSEAGQEQLGGDLIALKLSEVIYAQAIRSYLSNGAGDTPLAGFTDPAMARALTVIHQSPAHPWTLEELSRVAGLSRTSLSTKFNQCLSMTPLGYITQWRMQLARQKLTDSRAPLIEIAEAVGYGSEAAFGRVFKKHFGVAPASYRKQKAAAVA
ncbi:MAG: AraC family transcriptional regulator [Pseudomonadota bacterium]